MTSPRRSPTPSPCARTDRPDCRSRGRGDGERPPRRLRSAGRCLARRWGARARAASPRGALPPFPRVRRVPAPACRRLGLSRLSGVAGRRCTGAARADDRYPRAASVSAEQPSPGDLRALKVGKGAVVGFNAAKSHQIVDMRECHILRPELFALVEPLRRLLGELLPPRRTGEVQLTLVDQGVDVLLKGVTAEGLQAIEALGDFAAGNGLARLSIDQGLGAETLYEPQPATITLSGVPVQFPVGGFLQATADGRRRWCRRCAKRPRAYQRSPICSPASGRSLWRCGAAYAAEASRDAAAALKRAGNRGGASRPLSPAARQRRAGAVRCGDSRSAARRSRRAGRGARRLNGAADRLRQLQSGDLRPRCQDAHRQRLPLEWVRPVGQFRWSTHVELAACFQPIRPQSWRIAEPACVVSPSRHSDARPNREGGSGRR